MSIEKELDSFILDSNNFRLVSQKQLAAGGNAIVYLIEDSDHNQYVAKVGKRPISTYQDEKNFIRELIILGKADNPCVINLKGFTFWPSFQDDDKKLLCYPTIVMEKAAAGSIRSKLELALSKKPDPEWTPTKRMISLAGTAYGMMHLHFKHIIHRDLKPDNVLLNDKLHPKITDFGLSKIQYDNNQTFSDQGTYCYMAPEYFEGENNYTNSVDVYAFAIMAYEVITLNRPYPPAKLKNFFKFTNDIIRGGRPQWPDDDDSINHNLQMLIERAWSYNESERPTFQEIFDLLTKEEYYIPGTDAAEYNEYLKSLGEHQEKVCLDPEAQSIVDEATKGNTEKMKEAAESFYDGIGVFPHNKNFALEFYRMYANEMSKDGAKNCGKTVEEETSLPKKIIEAEDSTEKVSEETSIDEQVVVEYNSIEKDQEANKSDKKSDKVKKAPAKEEEADEDKPNESNPEENVELDDETLIDKMPQDVKDILESTKSSEDLFEVAKKFKEGISPFPRNFQLSSHFFQKAYIASHKRNKRKVILMSGSSNNIDIKTKTNPSNDDENLDIMITNNRARSNTISPGSRIQHSASYMPNILAPLIFKAVEKSITHINIFLCGEKDSISSVLEAFKENQNCNTKKSDDSNFEILRIFGTSIAIYYPSDADQLDELDITNFVEDRTSKFCNPDIKLHLCLFCISKKSNAITKSIKNMIKLIYTVVFVTSVQETSSVKKIEKNINGVIYGAKTDLKKVGSSPVIFDYKSLNSQSHIDLIQNFVNASKDLPIFYDT